MSTRLDKYIWSVRLAKTRSKSADAISKGRVRLNGENIKPAKDVKVGDEINIHKHTAVFTFKVLQLLDRRVGAKLVSEYLLDITPEEEIEKLKVFEVSQKAYRDHGTGKPSKKNRRDLDDFLENW
jgi:ribosome-associated heat shock protein Hsp15